MAEKIDISELDRIELLQRLWTNQSVAPFFTSKPNIEKPKFDYGQAKDILEEKEYIDYFCGRCIKTNLTEDLVNPRSYDRDAGEGTFASIVKDMRNSKPMPEDQVRGGGGDAGAGEDPRSRWQEGAEDVVEGDQDPGGCS